MKRVELERWLRFHGAAPTGGRGRGCGCGNHDTWQHTETGAKAFIPRHRELPTELGRAICRQLGIPPIQKR